MQLSSARDLKAQLLQEPQLRSIATTATLPPSARGMTSALPASRMPTAIALGVCRAGRGYRLAVRVNHAFPGVQSLLERIRAEARGEVDVRLVGRVVKQVPWHRTRNRPILIGGSLGHHRITAGTLGAFVTRDGAQDFLLSNNHVLANENKAKSRDRILQPGPTDGGKSPSDLAARLEKFVRLEKAGVNFVDCAMAAPEVDVEYYPNWIKGLGVLSGIRRAPLEEDEPVAKVGRTTGLTWGRISALEIDDLQVEFDAGHLRFDDQLEIAPRSSQKPFSLGGDSGSLIVDSDMRAVGLLFAGNDVDVTYANPIQTVLDALDVDLVF